MKQFLLLCALLVLAGCSEQLTGYAVAYPGFGGSVDVYDNNRVIFSVPEEINASQGVFSIPITYNQENGFIFKKGYVQTATGWEVFEFDQDPVSDSNWIATTASTTLTLNQSNFALGENYVIAYACKYYDGWRCGNTEIGPASRQWMLQTYELDVDFACSDSDGGKDYEVTGTINGAEFTLGAGAQTFTDTCLRDYAEYQAGNYTPLGISEDDGIVEAYCGADDYAPGIIEAYECFFGCDQGACLPATQNCIDADYGQHEFVAGSVTYNLMFNESSHTTITDSCSGNTLSEVYCDGSDNAATASITCSNGCQNGACIPDNMVLAFTFEGDQDTVALDMSGNNNHGQITGATRVSDCQSGMCMQFDGNDYILVADADSLDFTTQMTIAYWIKMEATSSGKVAMKDGNFIMGAWFANPNGYAFETYTPTQTMVTTGVDPIVGQWQHVTAVLDGSQVKIYLNGVEQATNAVPAAMTPNSNDLYIGIQPNFLSGLRGTLDELRIYDEALSEQAICDLAGGCLQ